MNKKYSGFTLLELSIVLAIVAILLTLSFNSAKYFLEQNHIKATHVKLNAIQNALEVYLIQNNALPCPAGLALSTGEALSSCTSASSTNGLFVTDGVARGGVPYKDLNLTSDIALDSWNDKITYSVSIAALSDFRSMLDNFDGIYIFDNIYDNSDSERITNEAVYSINSHGKNKLGAYYKDGTVNSSTDIADQESINTPSSNYSNILIYFTDYKVCDDIGRYKTRMQMVIELGIEDINCYIKSTIVSSLLTDSGITATFTDIPTSGLLVYGDTIVSDDEEYKIQCFKYGRLGIAKNE
ncbi:MAG TPA: prepilin-type N-terminal cleavage/methylation domain-containing protein [Rickettsiales bacterium]|nr:prepilin-type N-terminal cleavage/methylation domain-containing protein [Rickettsiales bacterium]